MAANPSNPEIQRLIRQAADARSCLTTEFRDFRERIDVKTRLHDSLRSHTSGWLFGSLATGALAGLALFRRKPTVVVQKKPRGIVLASLGLILTAIRPLARMWLTERVKTHLLGKAGGYLTMKTAPARPIRPPSNPAS